MEDQREERGELRKSLLDIAVEKCRRKVLVSVVKERIVKGRSCWWAMLFEDGGGENRQCSRGVKFCYWVRKIY